MNEDNQIINCSRCGSEMSASARYCMKCGNLNEFHDDNKKYSKIFKKIKRKKYEVGSGGKLFNTEESSGVLMTTKNLNKRNFILFNGIILGIFFLILVISPLFFLEEFNVENIVHSRMFSGMVIYGLISIYLVCLQVIFIKADEHWWAALIPFYNIYRLSDIVFGHPLLFVLVFIPFINIIYLFVLFYHLGKAFNYNGWLTAFFSIIMFPIISSGGHPFRGIFYVDSIKNDAVEKGYKLDKFFISTGFFLFVVGFIGVFLSGTFISYIFSQPEKTVALLNSKVAIWNVQSAVKHESYNCIDASNNTYSIRDGNVYYFYSSDFNNTLGLKYDFFTPSKGFIKVVSDNGEFNFYVTYSDEIYGIKDVNSKNLDIDRVEDSFEVNMPNGIKCTID